MKIQSSTNSFPIFNVALSLRCRGLVIVLGTSEDKQKSLYSEVPIKSTVLLRVLFEYFQSISIKSTIHWEIRTKKALSVLFLLAVLFKFFTYLNRSKMNNLCCTESKLSFSSEIGWSIYYFSIELKLQDKFLVRFTIVLAWLRHWMYSIYILLVFLGMSVLFLHYWHLLCIPPR